MVANSQATSPSSSAAAAPARSFVPKPRFVGRQTLLSQAGIDCRVDDALHLEVQVPSSYPSQPVVGSVQYEYNAEAKRRTAVSFIGTKHGLGIKTPDNGVPRYLLLTGPAFHTAVSKLTPAQRQWHDQLTQLAVQDAMVVRDQLSDRTARADACARVLIDHLELTNVTIAEQKSGEVRSSTLWPDQEKSFNNWDELIAAGTHILKDSGPSASVDNGWHSYILCVRGANMQMTHILACVLSSWGLLRSQLPELTKKVTNICEGVVEVEPLTAADSTDSSSSDSESGEEKRLESDEEKRRKERQNKEKWQSGAPARGRVQNKQRKVQALQAFAAQHIDSDSEVASLFAGETTLPLLALVCRMTMRSWENRYVSFMIDNFQAIGCDTHDLGHDQRYLHLVAESAIAPPQGKWNVLQYNGDAAVALFVREELMDKVINICDQVHLLFGLDESVVLRIKSSVHTRNARGRTIKQQTGPVYLNKVVPIVRPSPQSARYPAGHTAPTLASNCWTERVALGLKRAADNTSANHRERKRSQQSDNTPPKPPVQPPNPPASAAPVQQSAPANSQPKQQPQHKQQPKPKPSKRPDVSSGQQPAAPTSSVHSTSVSEQILDERIAAAVYKATRPYVAQMERVEHMAKVTEDRLNLMVASFASFQAEITVQLRDMPRVAHIEALSTKFNDEMIKNNNVHGGQLQTILKALTQCGLLRPATTVNSASESDSSPLMEDGEEDEGEEHDDGVEYIHTPTTDTSASAGPAHNGTAPRHG